ncbi:MAG: AMP-binding protein [Pseudomonadota bacterium]
MPDLDFKFPRQSNTTMNLGHFLTQTAARLPNHPALIRDENQLSYGELNSAVDALAQYLTTMGVGYKDRVLIHSNNCFEMVIAIYAIWKVGAVIVPTNFRVSPSDVVKMGHASGSTAFIGNADFADYVSAVRDDGFADGRTLIIGGDFDDLIDANGHKGPFLEAEVIRNDPAWFFFTSGTTGFPKCAVLTHDQLGFVLTNHVADLMPGLSSRDASLVVAPLSHGAGLHLFINVTKGATNVLMPGDGLDPEDAFALIEKHRITNAFTVPTIIKRLVESDAAQRFDHSSLRHVIYAGAPMYRADQKRALEVLGKSLVQYFGLGEVTGCITVLPTEEHDLDDEKMRVGTVGYARTGIEIAILSNEGERLLPGEQGNIGVRGGAVMAGYLNNPEANAESFLNGWFITGDIGYLDEAGYLYLTGRRSDMYISGGSNVYPREIEEVLLTHPAIKEVAIVGVPDEKWGEAGIAVCVCESNPEEADLPAWIADRVVAYKRPRDIFFWDELPKSGYGKVEKKTIKAMLRDKGLIEDIA